MVVSQGDRAVSILNVQSKAIVFFSSFFFFLFSPPVYQTRMRDEYVRWGKREIMHSSSLFPLPFFTFVLREKTMYVHTSGIYI